MMSSIRKKSLPSWSKYFSEAFKVRASRLYAATISKRLDLEPKLWLLTPGIQLSEKVPVSSGVQHTAAQQCPQCFAALEAMRKNHTHTHT